MRGRAEVEALPLQWWANVVFLSESRGLPLPGESPLSSVREDGGRRCEVDPVSLSRCPGNISVPWLSVTSLAVES